MPVNQSVDLMDLAAVGTVADLTTVVVVETGAGHGGFVPGCMTVMAQFIFTTASFSLEGRPRMAGLGCLWHTSMNLPGVIKHQGGMAAK